MTCFTAAGYVMAYKIDGLPPSEDDPRTST